MEHVIPFILASLAIICSPGPSVTFLVTTSMIRGRKVAYQIIPGIFFGDLVAMILSFVGVGILIHAYPPLQLVLRIVGSLYLIYLGVRTFLSKKKRDNAQEENGIGFRNGFLIELANPKTILFFATFFPQFVSKTGNYWLQIGLLGVIFLVIGLVNDLTYSTFAAFISKFLNDKVLTIVPKVGGLIMILSALMMILA